MTRNLLKYPDVVALADAIRAICHKSTNGAVYDEGWSDQRLVDESQGRVSLANVVRLRRELVGDLPKTDGNNRALENRLAELELWASQRKMCPFKRES